MFANISHHKLHKSYQTKKGCIRKTLEERIMMMINEFMNSTFIRRMCYFVFQKLHTMVFFEITVKPTLVEFNLIEI